VPLHLNNCQNFKGTLKPLRRFLFYSIPLRLQTLSVFRRGLAEVFLAIATEVRQGVEVHHVCNLGERESLIFKEFFQNRDGGVGDVGGDAGAGDAADGI